MTVESSYGPWKEAVPQSTHASFGCSVPSARMQQFKQLMSRVAAIHDDRLSSAEIGWFGNAHQRRQLAANDFVCWSYHSLKRLFISSRAPCVSHWHATCKNWLCTVEGDEQPLVCVDPPEHSEAEFQTCLAHCGSGVVWPEEVIGQDDPWKPNRLHSLYTLPVDVQWGWVWVTLLPVLQN